MSIALRAAQGSNNAGGGTSITMTKPTGTVTGDVMVMSVTARGGTGTSIDTRTPFAQQTVSPSTFSAWCVTYGNGLFVAGANASVFTSPDGISWTKQTTGLTNMNNIYGVAYGGGTYVAVNGFLGSVKISSSTDGFSWTNRTSPFGSGDIMCVAYGNGYFVLGTESGQIATSPDGVSWTSQGAVFSLGQQCFGLAYSDDQALWVAVGNNSELYTATDPTGTWTSQTSSFTTTIHGVAYGGGTWVAVGGGEVASSSNGTSWTQRTNSGISLEAVAYGNGGFMAVGGSNSLITSPDGITWGTRTSSYNASDTLTGIAFGSLAWVISGWDAGTSFTKIATSLTWEGLGAEVTSGTTLKQAVYWRPANNEPASYVITITSAKASGVIISLSGADLLAPDATQYAGQANASSATVTAPSIGTWPARSGFDLFFGGTATGTTAAPPSGYAEPANGESASTGGGAGSRTTSGVGYLAMTDPTSVGSLTATYGNDAINIGHHVFIQEERPRVPRISPYLQVIR